MVKMAKFPHETNTDMNVCDHNGTMFHFTVLNDHTEVLKVKVTLNQYVNTVVVFCTDFGWTSKNTLHAHLITDLQSVTVNVQHIFTTCDWDDLRFVLWMHCVDVDYCRYFVNCITFVLCCWHWG